MVFNALFVFGLNQDQIKERLTAVYGMRVWPDYNVLSNEFHMYLESTERITVISRSTMTVKSVRLRYKLECSNRKVTHGDAGNAAH